MTADSIRLLNLGLAVAGMIGWLLLARSQRYRGYAIAILSWLINVVALWTFAILTDGQAEVINAWSRFVYLQALVLLVGSALILLWRKDR